MSLDSRGQPTTKLCGCGRELGRTARHCPGCGYDFRWWLPNDSVESIAVAPTAPVSPDLTDHELLLAKLRAIGLPEVLKWERLAMRYALAQFNQERAG